jgi:hypothetical protein
MKLELGLLFNKENIDKKAVVYRVNIAMQASRFFEASVPFTRQHDMVTQHKPI